MMERGRKREGLRECRAAWLIGVSVREYREIEAGERDPDFKTWRRMCDVFNWPRPFQLAPPSPLTHAPHPKGGARIGGRMRVGDSLVAWRCSVGLSPLQVRSSRGSRQRGRPMTRRSREEPTQQTGPSAWSQEPLSWSWDTSSLLGS